MAEQEPCPSNALAGWSIAESIRIYNIAIIIIIRTVWRRHLGVAAASSHHHHLHHLVQRRRRRQLLLLVVHQRVTHSLSGVTFKRQHAPFIIFCWTQHNLTLLYSLWSQRTFIISVVRLNIVIHSAFSPLYHDDEGWDCSTHYEWWTWRKRTWSATAPWHLKSILPIFQFVFQWSLLPPPSNLMLIIQGEFRWWLQNIFIH